MHPSVLAFAAAALSADDVSGKRVVEAGAYDYNGSVRGLCEPLAASYTGTDAQPGPGVDEVCPAEKLPDLLGEGSADVVICTEMLEHAEDWRGAVAGLVRLLAPGGLLLLTTRSAGFPFHPHPGDFHRFSPDHLDAAAEACGLDVRHLESDPEAPGVFLLACKPGDWDATGMREGLAVIEPGPPR